MGQSLAREEAESRPSQGWIFLFEILARRSVPPDRSRAAFPSVARLPRTAPTVSCRELRLTIKLLL
jgi:hypothetical protein